MSQQDASTPQERFDSQYISSREIVQRLGVTRPTVSQAHKRGLLPSPIIIAESQIYIWERAAVEPMLQAWALMLNAKRAAKA